MKLSHTPILALGAALALLGQPAAALEMEAPPARIAKPPAPNSLSIPHTRLTLPNGLTVLLSPDSTLPTVTVSVMVKTGSRFERAGRSGFAHLFEHLMFMGTDRVPTGQFDASMEAEGAWNNAWTSEDRTYYYEVGPSHSLPLLLWLEADRLTSLETTMSQAKLDAQRAVVKNERRERTENKPYGKASLRLPELLYPKGHPYHHPVIGSHADLEAASVADVKSFFGDFYSPQNLILTVVGDFDPVATEATIVRLFSGLQRRSVPDAPTATTPTLPGVVRETMQDKVSFRKLTLAWHSPPLFSQEDAALDVLSSVLSQGKTSRLHKGLLFDKQLAQSVSAHQGSQELSSVFQIDVVLRPDAKLSEVEALIDRALTDVAEKGVSELEVTRAKNTIETAFVRRLEAADNRASQLSTYQSYFGDAGAIERDIGRYRGVKPVDVQAAAKKYLDLKKRVILLVEPLAEPATKKAGQ